MSEDTTQTTSNPEENTEKVSVETSPQKETSTTSESKSEDRGGHKGRRGRRDRNAQREPKEFEEAILQIDRVTRVVKGGRRLRFRVSVVIGDQKGRVGFGVGKANEVMIGIQKAVSKAKKSLINVPIFNDTLPHPVTQSFKSSQVLLFPAPEGKGVIAGGAVRRILELAGIKNVLSKIHGSRNKLNVARATLKALKTLHNQAPHGMKTKEETDTSTKKVSKESKDVEKKVTPESKKPKTSSAKSNKKSTPKK